MSTTSIREIRAAIPSPSQNVSISPWVNEPFPDWARILTAHDVARLIRRPPWTLRPMTAIGRFPRMQRFRGKQIGWLKEDIWAWIAEGRPVVADKGHGMPGAPSAPLHPQSLPLCFPVADPWRHRVTVPLKTGVPS
jgi:predicted DNA-binding transcriptional regulator AlpA